MLYPPENRQPITVVQQQFGGPASGHISGILTDEYSDDLSVALGSQEGLSVEESKGMRTDILSELGNVVANRFLTEWTRQSGIALETKTPTCHNIGLETLEVCWVRALSSRRLLLIVSIVPQHPASGSLLSAPALRRSSQLNELQIRS